MSKLIIIFFTNLLLFGYFSAGLDNFLHVIVFFSIFVIRDYFFWFLHVRYFDLAASLHIRA